MMKMWIVPSFLLEAQTIDVPVLPAFYFDSVDFEHIGGLAVVEERIGIFKHMRNDFFLVVILLI